MLRPVYQDVPPPVNIMDRIRGIPAGKSLFIPGANPRTVSSAASRVAAEFGRKRKFVVRGEDDGARVWRVE